MKYTVVKTEKTNGNVHVAVPGLPDCDVESSALHVDTPWEQFEKFRGNPLWEQVFDDIEQQRK